MKLGMLLAVTIGLAVTSGCQSTRHEPTEHVIAIGDPVEFVYADWTFDFCAAANASSPGESGCVQVGGEVYKGEFANLKVLAGHLPANTKYVGVVGHALRKDQRNAAPMLLVLRRSIPELLSDTGLQYFTIDRRTVDKKVCFPEKLEVTTGLSTPRLRYTGIEGGSYCYHLK